MVELSTELKEARRSRLIERVRQAVPEGTALPRTKPLLSWKLIRKDIEKIPVSEILRHWVNEVNLLTLSSLDLDYYGPLITRLREGEGVDRA